MSFYVWLAGFALSFALWIFYDVARGKAYSIWDFLPPWGDPVPFFTTLFWPLGMPFLILLTAAVEAGKLFRKYW